MLFKSISFECWGCSAFKFYPVLFKSLCSSSDPVFPAEKCFCGEKKATTWLVSSPWSCQFEFTGRWDTRERCVRLLEWNWNVLFRTGLCFVCIFCFVFKLSRKKRLHSRKFCFYSILQMTWHDFCELVQKKRSELLVFFSAFKLRRLWKEGVNLWQCSETFKTNLRVVGVGR